MNSAVQGIPSGRSPLTWLCLFVAWLSAGVSSTWGYIVRETVRHDDGVIEYRVESEFQPGIHSVRVLLPKSLEPGLRYPVLYVLPVEAGVQNRYGDGLATLQRLDIANRHQVICVAPSFERIPWYADHPSNLEVRQESYFLHVVMLLVESLHPTKPEADGRFLLGFSKSGWGALSLLFRYPDRFGGAAAWDAPLMMGWPSLYGSSPIFENEFNFRDYQLTRHLERGLTLPANTRVVLTGFGNFRAQMKAFHDRLTEADIRHFYDEGTRQRHHWDGGWVNDAVNHLLPTR